MPAAVKIMARVAAGGDTKKLFKMMEKGELDPNKYLPLFFRELDIESAGGMDAYRNSIRGSQNFAAVEFENALGVFGKGGGNQGLINFWKDSTEIIKQLTPSIERLGGAFKVLSGAATGVGYTLAGIANSFTSLLDGQSSFTGWATAIAGGFGLIATRVGRLTFGLTALVLLLEDIAVYNRGGKSLIGEALGEDSKGVAALAGLAAIIAGKNLFSRDTSSTGGKDGATKVKKGFFGGGWASLLNPWTAAAGGTVAVAALSADASKSGYAMTPINTVGVQSTANFMGMSMQGINPWTGKKIEPKSPSFPNTPFWEWGNGVSPSQAMNPSVNLVINVTAQTNNGNELGKQIADQVMHIFPNR